MVSDLMSGVVIHLVSDVISAAVIHMVMRNGGVSDIVNVMRRVVNVMSVC